MKPKYFKFSSYRFEPENRKVFFDYELGLEDATTIQFTETIELPTVPEIDKVSKPALEAALQGVHLILGTSYLKLYYPKDVQVNYQLSEQQAKFWNTVYCQGMGEFLYVNKLDPADAPQFPFDPNYHVVSSELPKTGRALVGVGGGKDSIVAGELLKENDIPITAFVVETQKGAAIIDNVISEMGIDSLVIRRFLDPKIFEKYEGSFNGHIPISMVFAFLGQLAAVLYGYDYFVVANEYSSNFGNIEYKGLSVNHQWSKSAVAEKLFQDYTREFVTTSFKYFSLLRPFYEIRIVQMFSNYKQYYRHFSSCNKSFLVNEPRPGELWCGQCPKCVFMFVLLSAFISKDELLSIYGKNLYEDATLMPTFRDILGFGEMKPFDCVGTFEEAQAALNIAKENYADTVIVKEFGTKVVGVEEKLHQVMCTNPAPTIPSSLRFLGMNKLLILGYGREGKVTEEFLKREYPEAVIEIGDKEFDPDYLNKQSDYDLGIKTPGMPPHLVTIPYTTATNLFFNRVKALGNTIIGVTGSKGKSTTTSLVYAFLKEAGHDVQLLGNIGVPMLSALFEPIPKNRIFVLELSSYMLNDLDVSPDVAVVTNLFPEHMDWHGGIEEYYEAKKHIISYQDPSDHFVYNKNNERLANWAKDSRSQVHSFAESIPVADQEIPLLGKHNRENIKAAIVVAKIFGISNEVIAEAIKKFEPLRHRLQPVGEYQGIKFFDDAISTTPESTIAALEAIPQVGMMFLGGQDRGYDFTELEKEIRKRGITNFVLFPESGSRIFSDRQGLNILETADMEEAVSFAYKYTPKGTVCLLSCASPSYSVWKNFEEKGDEFQKYVKKLA